MAVGATVTGGPDGGGNNIGNSPEQSAQQFGALYGAPTTHVGSTEFDIVLGEMKLAFTGAGFGSFDANGMPQVGHVTGLTVSDAVTAELGSSWQNISINVPALEGYITGAHNGDLTAVPTMLGKLFGGNDHFISTVGPPDGGGDTFNGGSGDDVITGGRGGDTLTGGPGVDTFHFNGPVDSTVAAPDLITDFTHTDRIDLSAIDADTTTGGDQAFHMGATAGHAGDIQFHYDAGHNQTVVDLYTHHNTVIGAEFLLTGNIALTASDFIL